MKWPWRRRRRLSAAQQGHEREVVGKDNNWPGSWSDEERQPRAERTRDMRRGRSWEGQSSTAGRAAGRGLHLRRHEAGGHHVGHGVDVAAQHPYGRDQEDCRQGFPSAVSGGRMGRQTRGPTDLGMCPGADGPGLLPALHRPCSNHLVTPRTSPVPPCLQRRRCAGGRGS